MICASTELGSLIYLSPDLSAVVLRGREAFTGPRWGLSGTT